LPRLRALCARDVRSACPPGDDANPRNRTPEAFVCSGCGGRAIISLPDWSDYKANGMGGKYRELAPKEGLSTLACCRAKPFALIPEAYLSFVGISCYKGRKLRPSKRGISAAQFLPRPTVSSSNSAAKAQEQSQ
jgi:hypothetical protein